MELLRQLLEVKDPTYKLTTKASDSDIKRFKKDIAFTARRSISRGMIPLILKALKAGIVKELKVVPPTASNKNAGFIFKFKNGIFDEQDIHVIQRELKAALKGK